MFIPLGGPSVDAAWRPQCLSRLAGPVFIPLGGPSVYPAWRAQCLSRLAGPVFIPLGGPSVYPTWRAQCLSRLARAQCLSRLAGPVFIPLGAGEMMQAGKQRQFFVAPAVGVATAIKRGGEIGAVELLDADEVGHVSWGGLRLGLICADGDGVTARGLVAGDFQGGWGAIKGLGVDTQCSAFSQLVGLRRNCGG